MLRYELTFDDVGAVRFAISPLSETARSLRVARAPHLFPELSPWVARISRSAGRPDPLLAVLVDRHLCTPDSLTRSPDSTMSSIEVELAELRGFDPVIFLRQLSRMHGTVPPVVRGLRDPLGAVADALGEYWSAAMAPHWDGMRRTLEADIAHRGHMITRSGLMRTLDMISPALRLHGKHVVVDAAVSRREEVDGRSIVLMPSMFARQVAVPTDPGDPLILYPARGQAVARDAFQCPAGALDALIGSRRAELLRMLDLPASSTELADRLGLSVPAVNQHLKALQGARLLGTARRGRYVLYNRTALGDALVGRRVD